MLTLYFSGTGNTKYIAELFSRKMDAACFSIEAAADFSAEIKRHDTIAVCYPIYGSRVPLIMREFVAKHIADFKGKKLIIFVTQLAFSGDGARVLTDLFPLNHIEVIYAEHFFMPNNISNTFFLRQRSDKSYAKKARKADRKMDRVCHDIRNDKVKQRGFSAFSKLIGKIQGKPWQGDSRNPSATKGTMEYKAKHSVVIGAECNACKICVKCCPMKNFSHPTCVDSTQVETKNNCTACYRCINLCPKKAISVWFSRKPTWQYKNHISLAKKETLP
jgi:ferredoxin